MSLQQDIRNHLTANNITHVDNTGSYELLDFTITNSKNIIFNLEAKEKIKKIVPENWGIKSEDEEFIFILDDLSYRKVLFNSPCSGLIIKDNQTNLYHWLSKIDLSLMPKTRCNRKVYGNDSIKGKILIDLRSSFSSYSLKDIFNEMKKFVDNFETLYIGTNECYGNYYGENIQFKGIIRTKDHLKEDVDKTK